MTANAGLVIAGCAVIACAESWDDGRSKLVWLVTFLELPNGIPSHDTSRRVFMVIDPDLARSKLIKAVKVRHSDEKRYATMAAAGYSGHRV